MPRSVSPVTTRAESQSTPSAPTGAVHTLSTPLGGAIHARLVPFGEIRGLTRSGFPKRTRPGMSSAMRHAYHAGQGDQYYPELDIHSASKDRDSSPYMTYTDRTGS